MPWRCGAICGTLPSRDGARPRRCRMTSTIAPKGSEAVQANGKPTAPRPVWDQRIVRSAFPRIGDYAFISDCQVTALIAPSGNIEWMCLPRMDSPSVFGAMLDRDAGGFRIGPADMMVPTARRYLPGTLVLET